MQTLIDLFKTFLSLVKAASGGKGFIIMTESEAAIPTTGRFFCIAPKGADFTIDGTLTKVGSNKAPIGVNLIIKDGDVFFGDFREVNGSWDTVDGAVIVLYRK